MITAVTSIVFSIYSKMEIDICTEKSRLQEEMTLLLYTSYYIFQTQYAVETTPKYLGLKDWTFSPINNCTPPSLLSDVTSSASSAKN